MRVLYLTNIVVPYRATYFNQLAEHVDLTVVCDRASNKMRWKEWMNCSRAKFDVIYLSGIPFKTECSISLRIFKVLREHWDVVIVGCTNSPNGIMAMSYMRRKGIKFIINMDGDYFQWLPKWKVKLKIMFMKKSSGILLAGEKSLEHIPRNLYATGIPISMYHFSSMTASEVEENILSEKISGQKVLIVGQYWAYKGLDVALEVARMSPDIDFIFVGTGVRTDKFVHDNNVMDLPNVEVIPFLNKKALYEQFKSCKCFVLPSRRECWGLVVNEAASFGAPIISTYGSGAACDFLSSHTQYLAEPSDANSLKQCLDKLLATDLEEYSDFLKNKSREYTIEENVHKTIELISIICQ